MTRSTPELVAEGQPTVEGSSAASAGEAFAAAPGEEKTARPQKIEVVPADDRHDAAVADFFRKVWSETASADEVHRGRTASSNPAAPGGAVPAFAFLVDDEVVGYIGTIPTRIFGPEGERRAHWMKGFMVLPEHRNGPVGYLVLKEATRRLGVAAVLTVADPSRRLFEALGFRNLGLLTNQILPLRPGRIASSIDAAALGLDRIATSLPKLVRVAQRMGVARAVGGVVGLGYGAWQRLLRMRKRSLVPEYDLQSVPGTDIDALQERLREQVRSGAIRDAAHLKWRYPAPPDGAYTAVALRERGELIAVGIVRLPRENGDERLRGIRVATLSDALFPPNRPDAGVALIAEAARMARGQGADALLGSATHPALQGALRRCGALPFPPNVHFLVRDAKKEGGFPAALSDWWVTRGDANSDEVF